MTFSTSMRLHSEAAFTIRHCAQSPPLACLAVVSTSRAGLSNLSLQKMPVRRLSVMGAG